MFRCVMKNDTSQQCLCFLDAEHFLDAYSGEREQ